MCELTFSLALGRQYLFIGSVEHIVVFLHSKKKEKQD
jgi:hypothetical protein